MSQLGDVLRFAASQIGTHEEPPGSNLTKYGAWYGLNGDAWCGMFVSYCAEQVGLIKAGIVPKFAYTPSGAAWFKARGQWGTEPRPGAIAFYNISGLNRISHTGWVEQLGAKRGSFYAIEGNTNGSGIRTGGEVWRQIRTNMGPGGGFGYPAYRVEPKASPAAAVTIEIGTPASAGATPYRGRLIRYRDSLGRVLDPSMQGSDVREAQVGLNRHAHNLGITPLVEDGDWGQKSDAMLFAYQGARHLAPFNLAVDRVVGPATLASFWL